MHDWCSSETEFSRSAGKALDFKRSVSAEQSQFNCELDSMLISANTIMCPLRQEDRLMKIELNHTIVPAHDKEKSAQFYERILGFKYEGPMGHFA